MTFKVLDVMKPYKEQANRELPPLVRKYLEMQGYQMMSSRALEPIFTDKDDSKLASLLKDWIAKCNAALDKATKFMTLDCLEKKSTLAKQSEASGRVEQDAEAPLEFEEPKATETKYSEPVDLPTASNALGEDYPNTQGHINETSDYHKINKETGLMEFVHRSGTCIKIDADGNVTIQATGSVKQIISGSMCINVSKGLDIVAGDGIYIHGKELEILSDDKINIEGMDIVLKGTSYKVDSPEAEYTSSQIKANSAMLEVGLTGKFGGVVSAPGIAAG